MVTEWTGELSVQVPRHLLLRRRLPLGLPASHLSQRTSALTDKREEHRHDTRKNTARFHRQY